MLRYDPIIHFKNRSALGEMEERGDGDWVNFECAEKLIKKLDQIAQIYENPEPVTLHELSIRAYEMRSIARAAINESCLEQSPNLPPLRSMTAQDEVILMAPVMGDALINDVQKLRDALERIAQIYENTEEPSIHKIASRAYDMRCIARSAISP